MTFALSILFVVVLIIVVIVVIRFGNQKFDLIPRDVLTTFIHVNHATTELWNLLLNAEEGSATTSSRTPLTTVFRRRCDTPEPFHKFYLRLMSEWQPVWPLKDFPPTLSNPSRCSSCTELADSVLYLRLRNKSLMAIFEHKTTTIRKTTNQKKKDLLLGDYLFAFCCM